MKVFVLFSIICLASTQGKKEKSKAAVFHRTKTDKTVIEGMKELYVIFEKGKFGESASEHISRPNLISTATEAILLFKYMKARIEKTDKGVEIILFYLENNLQKTGSDRIFLLKYLIEYLKNPEEMEINPSFFDREYIRSIIMEAVVVLIEEEKLLRKTEISSDVVLVMEYIIENLKKKNEVTAELLVIYVKENINKTVIEAEILMEVLEETIYGSAKENKNETDYEKHLKEIVEQVMIIFIEEEKQIFQKTREIGLLLKYIKENFGKTENRVELILTFIKETLHKNEEEAAALLKFLTEDYETSGIEIQLLHIFKEIETEFELLSALKYIHKNLDNRENVAELLVTFVKETFMKTDTKTKVFLKYVKYNLEKSEYEPDHHSTFKQIVNEAIIVIIRQQGRKLKAEMLFWTSELVLGYIKENLKETEEKVAELLLIYIKTKLDMTDKDAKMLLEYMKDNLKSSEIDPELLLKIEKIVNITLESINKEKTKDHKTEREVEAELIVKYAKENLDKIENLKELLVTYIKKNITKPDDEVENILEEAVYMIKSSEIDPKVIPKIISKIDAAQITATEMETENPTTVEAELVVKYIKENLNKIDNLKTLVVTYVKENLTKTGTDADKVLKEVITNIISSEIDPKLIPKIVSKVDAAQTTESLNRVEKGSPKAGKHDIETKVEAQLIVKFIKENLDKKENLTQILVTYIKENLTKTATEAELILKYLKENSNKLGIEVGLLAVVEKIANEAESIFSEEKEKLGKEAALLLKYVRENFQKSENITEDIVTYMKKKYAANEAEEILKYVEDNLKYPDYEIDLIRLLGETKFKKIVIDAEKRLADEAKRIRKAVYEAAHLIKFMESILNEPENATELIVGYIKEHFYKTGIKAKILLLYVAEMLKSPEFDKNRSYLLEMVSAVEKVFDKEIDDKDKVGMPDVASDLENFVKIKSQDLGIGDDVSSKEEELRTKEQELRLEFQKVLTISVKDIEARRANYTETTTTTAT